MTRSLKRAPVVLTLLLPIVTFIIIGRTVEIARDRITYPDVNEVTERALTDVVAGTLGLAGTSSAGAGISTSSSLGIETSMLTRNYSKIDTIPIATHLYTLDTFPTRPKQASVVPTPSDSIVPDRSVTVSTWSACTLLPIPTAYRYQRRHADSLASVWHLDPISRCRLVNQCRPRVHGGDGVGQLQHVDLER